MNNEDMSEIIQKLSSMLNSSDNTSTHQQNADNSNDVSSNSNQLNEETFRTILNQLNLNQSSEQNSEHFEQSSNNFHFDMNTLLKMKTVMDKMNSTKNDPRANLLYSLKPYLNQNRKEKLEQYMQILNISKIIDAFNSEGGVNQK